MGGLGTPKREKKQTKGHQHLFAFSSYENETRVWETVKLILYIACQSASLNTDILYLLLLVLDMKRGRKIPKWWIHLSIWMKAGACAYNIGISWKRKKTKTNLFFFFSFWVLFPSSGDPLGICRHRNSKREMYTQSLIHHVVKWSEVK